MLCAALTPVKQHWRDLIPAAALMIAVTAAIAVATLWPSGDRGQYAVIAPPSYDLGRTIGLVRAAGGSIVDVGGLTNVVILHSADKNAVNALYHAGAWLVIDPQLLRGCAGFHQVAISPGASA
ncbi:hypothetical protein [Novosphingobium humi]|uniref:Uncharacterized protein n=1 Tax=Novosphingobium humi TaxID=2282397 RepID=A0ABY7TZ82_9SPHN|nr:hypothetical protein [Novosphingobium humi]WCT78588.1 hypothetical protein PQ457_06400 [Novosphingobium humi]